MATDVDIIVDDASHDAISTADGLVATAGASQPMP
jgi:hypothetical protein